MTTNAIARILAMALSAGFLVLPTYAGPAGGEQGEKFIPPNRSAGSVLEFRSQATIHGEEIKLRQVCRWADSDASFFTPLADLIVGRCGAESAVASVSLDDVRRVLGDSGANLALIQFSGVMTCTVSRSDVETGEGGALRQWIAAEQGKAPAAAVGTAPATAPASSGAEVRQPVPVSSTSSGRASSASSGQAPSANSGRVVATIGADAPRNLHDLLVGDASVRLNLPVEQLQITFNPADEKMLALSEPLFKFNIDARRVYNLGDVYWDVSVITGSGSKKIHVNASARAWQNQVLLNRPLAYKQIIQDSDLTDHRVLVDRVVDEPLITHEQAVGQEAARDLKPGTVLTARMIDPVELVKATQYVSITVNQGGVSIKTTGKAIESGSFGQLIRVKNEATQETYVVTVTGPQEAELGSK